MSSVQNQSTEKILYVSLIYWLGVSVLLGVAFSNLDNAGNRLGFGNSSVDTFRYVFGFAVLYALRIFVLLLPLFLSSRWFLVSKAQSIALTPPELFVLGIGAGYAFGGPVQGGENPLADAFAPIALMLPVAVSVTAQVMGTLIGSVVAWLKK